MLIPKRSFSKWWHRILHDRTAQGVFKVLGEMDNVNVTIVPFRLGKPRPGQLTPVSDRELRKRARA